MCCNYIFHQCISNQRVIKFFKTKIKFLRDFLDDRVQRTDTLSRTSTVIKDGRPKHF